MDWIGLGQQIWTHVQLWDGRFFVRLFVCDVCLRWSLTLTSWVMANIQWVQCLSVSDMSKLSHHQLYDYITNLPHSVRQQLTFLAANLGIVEEFYNCTIGFSSLSAASGAENYAFIDTISSTI